MATDKAPVERVHPPASLMKLVNPLTKRILRRGKGKMVEQALILHFTGRKSGRSYSIPVGFQRIDGRMALLTNSGWRHNFRGGADVRITLAGETAPARAELLSDSGAVAEIYDRLIGEMGWKNAGAQLGIRINVERRPTVEELRDAIKRSGLSIVWIDPVSP
ncbi:MAG TPA: nitroreductase/quinone reductase family protein [Actinomycetota bacterium]|nr:nitroreductase/quinone reductase family protein [Actinomycetota bacterium]